MKKPVLQHIGSGISIEQMMAEARSGLTFENLEPSLQRELKDPIIQAEIRAEEQASRRAAMRARVEHATAHWNNLPTGHKVNASISGACALMSAYGTLSAAKNSIARDENGKAHVQWSQVGVALLQATVAAGCAYFAVEALHGRSGFSI